MRMDAADGVIETGAIHFGPRLARTSGATAAVFLQARHVFDDLGYRRLAWGCDAENEPSRRAALRLGFAYEGTFRRHRAVEGRHRSQRHEGQPGRQGSQHRPQHLAEIAAGLR